jgi:hypothetical protein
MSQDAPLHWPHARAAGTLVDALNRQLHATACEALLPL